MLHPGLGVRCARSLYVTLSASVFGHVIVVLGFVFGLGFAVLGLVIVVFGLVIAVLY